jgi:hypothetical protein
VKAYRIAVAILGTFVAIAVAAITAAYLVLLALPFCMVVGFFALWLVARYRSVHVPIGAAIAGTLGLAVPSVVYIANQGNWNDPGTQWLLLPLLVGIVLLGATAFGIYVRDVAGGPATLIGGAALLVACPVAFWWLLQVDSGRADLYIYRLLAALVGVYAVLAAILAADRLLRR